MATFTWDGKAVDIVSDVDSWTGKELRQVETMLGGTLNDVSFLSTLGAIVCVSIARTTGAQIADVDARITFGQLKAILSEMNVADGAVQDAQNESVPGDVLSPTSADSEA